MNTRILDSMADLDRDAWDRLFAGACEGYDYFVACEQAPPENFLFYAIGVFEGERLVAGAPVFRLALPLDQLVEGVLRKLARGLCRAWPGGLSIPMIGLGSPHADELPLRLEPGLNPEQRQQVIKELDEGLLRHARESGAHVLLLKNITPSQRHSMGATLEQIGYASMATLPIAKLAIPESDQAYIQSLSANMRSNIRRKLKRAAKIRVEIREGIEPGLEQQLPALREATRTRAKADYGDFAAVSPGYFAAVMSKQGSGAKLMLYWLEEQLVGFAIALTAPGRLKEKYTGLKYPEALQYGVFFLNWMTMLRLGQENGVAEFHSGETTYLTKQRLGCHFERSWIYLKHRNRVINALLRWISPWLAMDQTDPDLKQLGEKAPYRDRP